MPKKTKKQKILAQLHRKHLLNFKLNSEFVKSQNNNSATKLPPSYSASVSFVKEPATRAKTTNGESAYGFVKRDLIKITIFTAFALTLQGMLYFLLRTR